MWTWLNSWPGRSPPKNLVCAGDGRGHWFGRGGFIMGNRGYIPVIKCWNTHMYTYIYIHNTWLGLTRTIVIIINHYIYINTVTIRSYKIYQETIKWSWLFGTRHFSWGSHWDDEMVKKLDWETDRIPDSQQPKGNQSTIAFRLKKAL